MTSNFPWGSAVRRRLTLLAVLAVLVAAGCGDAGANKPVAPPEQPAPQPQKVLPPGAAKME